jgi:hypothetical protein
VPKLDVTGAVTQLSVKRKSLLADMAWAAQSVEHGLTPEVGAPAGDTFSHVMDKAGDADDEEDVGTIPSNVIATSFVAELDVTGLVTTVGLSSR